MIPVFEGQGTVWNSVGTAMTSKGRLEVLNLLIVIDSSV